MRTITMPHVHLVDKKALLRANRALALGLLWGGLAFCVVAAAVYDVRHWFAAW